MKFKQTSLATALLAALVMGAPGQASAGVYAGAGLNVQNFTIDISNLTAPALTGYTFTTQASSSLTGFANAVDTDTCGTIGGPACGTSPNLQSSTSLGAGAPNPLSFSFSPVGGGATYAIAGAEITQSEVVNALPTVAKQLAETQVAGSGAGITTTSIGSETLFSFVFTVAPGTGDLVLAFEADPDLYVAVDTLQLLAAAATARVSASFNISGANGTQITWAPNGTLGGAGAFADCVGVTSCTENADAESLNVTRTLAAGNPSDNGFSDARNSPDVDPGFSLFGMTIVGLQAGDYTFTLTSQQLAQARQTVPEPGTLLLLGGGLLGIGMGAIRRGRKSKLAA